MLSCFLGNGVKSPLCRTGSSVADKGASVPFVPFDSSEFLSCHAVLYALPQMSLNPYINRSNCILQTRSISPSLSHCFITNLYLTAIHLVFFCCTPFCLLLPQSCFLSLFLFLSLQHLGAFVLCHPSTPPFPIHPIIYPFSFCITLLFHLIAQSSSLKAGSIHSVSYRGFTLTQLYIIQPLPVLDIFRPLQ